jgi:hypothetical protein
MDEARRLLLRSRKKLANDTRPAFRKQAADHLRHLATLAPKN